MKAALITGAGRRIGAEIAGDLARHGWHVLIHYHASQAEAGEVAARIAAAGGRASTIRADLHDSQAIDGLVARAFEVAPGLELVVNNASSFRHDTVASVTSDGMAESFAINATAPILLAQGFARRLPADRNGLVINLLDNRVVAPNPDYLSYGIAKFALMGATRMLALALAPRIRVNGIAPGITMESGGQSTAAFEAAHRRNPLRRGCTPEEVAAAVRFIAEVPAMTGEIITIDGGLALANPGRDVSFIDWTPQ